MKSAGIFRHVIGVCALAVAMSLAAPANAAFIQLSTHATGNNEAALFNALLEFTVTGNNLTLTVTNQTAAPNAFLIREVYFNTTAELTNLTAVDLPTGFALHSHSHAGGFGWFDYGLIGSNGPNAVIAPGETRVFSFTFTGSASDSDLLTELSSGPTPMIAAAKFVIGQNGPGGYGGSNAIPTPGSAAMIVLAILIGAPFRSRNLLRRAAAA